MPTELMGVVFDRVLPDHRPSRLMAPSVKCAPICGACGGETHALADTLCDACRSMVSREDKQAFVAAWRAFWLDGGELGAFADATNDLIAAARHGRRIARPDQ